MKNIINGFCFLMFLALMAILAIGCETGNTDTGGDTSGNFLPAPQNLIASSTSASQIRLEWTPVNSASYYNVYRATDSTWKNYIILNSSVTNTTYNDAGLSPDTTYYYKVGAKERFTYDPVGKLSESISATTMPPPDPSQNLPAPTNFIASVIDSSSGPRVTLTWTPVSGALYYAVYLSTDSTWSEYIIITNSITTTVFSYPYYANDLPLITGTTYYYKVGAKRQSSNDSVGDLSEQTVVYISPSTGTVTNISASALTEGSIKVTWSAVAGASKYRIYRAFSYSGVGEAVAYVNAPSTEFTDASLAPQTTYYYRIAVVDDNDKEGSQSNNYDWATTLASTIPPNNLTATANGRIITLEWDAVTGANSYQIYGSFTSGGTFVYIGNVHSNDGTSFNVQTMAPYGVIPLEPSTTYYFKVRVSGGVLSSEVSATTGT